MYLLCRKESELSSHSLHNLYSEIYCINVSFLHISSHIFFSFPAGADDSKLHILSITLC